MKNTNKLIGIIFIALFAINFISCDSDEENTKPTIKEYPKQVSTSNVDFCACTILWDSLKFDSIYVVNNVEEYNKYCHYASACAIDFSQNSLLILYSWYYYVPFMNIYDTIWQTSNYEYRWDVSANTPSDSNYVVRYVIRGLVPKLSDTVKFSANILHNELNPTK